MINRAIKWLKISHWLGLVLLVIAVVAYFTTALAQNVAGMVTIASLAGLGMVMMAPFPVVLFIQWARKQDD